MREKTEASNKGINVMTNYVNCFLDSARGIYIPQNFAESIDLKDWTGIKKSDFDILLAGPEAESYWDAWQSVLDNAESTCGAVLYQDGDLFLVYRDKGLQDLNDYLESVLEYETRHGDAGDAYAYMVPESVDLQDIQRQLAEETLLQGPGETALDARWTLKFPLNLRGLELDRVIELALACFAMVPGSIWGPYGDAGLVLAGFPVQEIETELPEQFCGLLLDLIGDNGAEAYIREGGRLAYMGTDSCWYACVSVKDLQDAIDAEVFEQA
jgi:hypothetical protein